MAETITVALPEGTIVGRRGGEEFAICLRVDDETPAMRMAQAARDAVRGLTLRAEDGSPIDLSVSLGIAAGDKGSSLSYLAADRAFYLAKAAGRDHVIAAWEMADLGEPIGRRRHDRLVASGADVALRAAGG